MPALLPENPGPARFEIVAAVADNGVIGFKNAIPWRLSADMQHFKALTTDQIILMGRQTYVSLGKPLPKRTNWVLSRDPAFKPPEDVVVFSDLSDVMAAAQGQRVMVIGGAQIYERFLSLATVLHLTEVHASPFGDTNFPVFDRALWTEEMRVSHGPDEKNEFSFDFLTLTRNSG